MAAERAGRAAASATDPAAKAAAEAAQQAAKVSADKVGETKVSLHLDADKTLSEAQTLAGELRTTLQAPLANAFDTMLATQGSLTDRLRAGTASFLSEIASMLSRWAAQMAAQRHPQRPVRDRD